jgi:hypothetical protein
METASVVDATGEYWSYDGERFSYDTLGELLDCNELQVGDTVHTGDGVTPDPAEWVDVEDVIEQLACRAYDECGEIAEDYPNVSDEAKAELKVLLEAWAHKHCTPTWYMIKDVIEYEITADDIAETNTSTGPTIVSLESPHDKDPPEAADIASGRTLPDSALTVISEKT